MIKKLVASALLSGVLVSAVAVAPSSAKPEVNSPTCAICWPVPTPR